MKDNMSVNYYYQFRHYVYENINTPKELLKLENKIKVVLKYLKFIS